MRPTVEEPGHECLLRIQNEISEVEKREIELRNEHAMISPRTSVNNESEHQTCENNNNNNNNNHLNDDDDTTRSQSPVLAAANICSKDHFKKNKTIAPQPKPQLLAPPALTRALSTPQLFNISPVKIGTPQRGIMQKFIASRGKLNVNANQINQQSPNSNYLKRNLIMAPIEFNSDSIKALQNLEKTPVIERDTKGKVIRKGYIPVEEKIQCELRDLKIRETELKRLHNRSNVRDSEDDYDDDAACSSDDNETEWKPINGKLSRSIDVLNTTSSPSTVDFQSSTARPIPTPRNANGAIIRPAVSLATLCDFEPDCETPSSHKLIERWESIIQENQQREKSYNIH